MDAIHQSSRKIADIIDVIDEIAFQTNLLALNAAVKAARAGEQASGIEQVNQAILQMDQVTQKNAGLVSQTASASQAIHEQTDELQSLMDFFRHEERSEAISQSFDVREAPVTRKVAIAGA